MLTWLSIDKLYMWNLITSAKCKYIDQFSQPFVIFGDKNAFIWQETPILSHIIIYVK